MRLSRSSFRGAFTLVEILLVCAIITVLMAILLPAISKLKTQAKRTTAISQLNALRSGLVAYYTDFNMYPPSANDPSPGGYLTIPDNRGDVMLAQGLLGFLPGDKDGAGSGIALSVGVQADSSDMGFRLTKTGGTMGGKISGPYAPFDAKTFKINSSPVNGSRPDDRYFIDPWGNEILYYRSTRSLPGSSLTNVKKVFRDATTDEYLFDLADCKASWAFLTQSKPPATAPTTVANGSAIYGLLGTTNNIVAGAVTGSSSFLLISAGPDEKYFTADDIVVTK